MSAIEPRQVAEVMNPVTGEMVPLDAATNVLADYLADIREFETGMRSAKRQVADELLRRMDAEATWTVHLPTVTVEGDGPGRVEYDAKALWALLSEFAENGVITRDALENAVERVVTFKAKAAGIKALHKLGGLIANDIDSCSRLSEKPRNVRVKR